MTTLGYNKFETIACVLLVISCVLFFSAYVSQGWVSQSGDWDTAGNNISDLSMGLWKTCYYDQQQRQTVCQNTENFLLANWNDDWLPGVQAIFTIVLVLSVSNIAITVPYVLSCQCQHHGPLLVFVAGCSSFATFMFLFLGILIFGIQQSSDTTNFSGTSLDWAYGMTIVATGFTGVACFLLTGTYYDILIALTKKKSLQKLQKHLVETLDNAAMETKNSSRRSQHSSRAQLSARQQNGEHSDSGSSVSSRSQHKERRKDEKQRTSDTPVDGIENPTYNNSVRNDNKNFAAMSVQRQEMGIPNESQAIEEDTGYVNDGSKPSTSGGMMHESNKNNSTRIVRHSNFSSDSDTDIDSTQEENNNSNSVTTTTAIIENHDRSDLFTASSVKKSHTETDTAVKCGDDYTLSKEGHMRDSVLSSDLFMASSLKNKDSSPDPEVGKSTENSDQQKVPPVELFRASTALSSHTEDSETPRKKNSNQRYIGILPPLGKPPMSRASYDDANMMPAVSKKNSSMYYNTTNQLVKSTPTELFITDTSHSQDPSSPPSVGKSKVQKTQTFILTASQAQENKDETEGEQHSEEGKKIKAPASTFGGNTKELRLLPLRSQRTPRTSKSIEKDINHGKVEPKSYCDSFENVKNVSPPSSVDVNGYVESQQMALDHVYSEIPPDPLYHEVDDSYV